MCPITPEFIRNASNKGIGMITAQRRPNKEEHPVRLKFTETGTRLSTMEKERTGSFFAIKKLRH